MAREYMPSEAVSAAEAAVQAQKNSRPEEYRSAWEAQLAQAMQKILNREAFQYNLNGDALYRQYQDQAIRNGRMAMLDTMGQAAALTGGYGSSYAQSVGQQAYNQQLSTLNDRIPELYQLAMEQYQMAGRDMLQQYQLLSGAEGRDYSRWQDAMDAWQQEADRLWREYIDQRDYDYGAYRDQVEDDQWQAEYDEDRRRYDQEWEDKHRKKKSQEPVVVYRPSKPVEPPAPTPPEKPSNPLITL